MQSTQFRVRRADESFMIGCWTLKDGEWQKLWAHPRGTLDGVASCLCIEALGYKPGIALSQFVRVDILESEKSTNFTIPLSRVMDSIARGAEARVLFRLSVNETEPGS